LYCNCYPQYLEAAAAAQRIDGVKNVHNHLEVVLALLFGLFSLIYGLSRIALGGLNSRAMSVAVSLPRGPADRC
jgi:hypothetical protein